MHGAVLNGGGDGGGICEGGGQGGSQVRLHRLSKASCWRAPQELEVGGVTDDVFEPLPDVEPLL
jgi:hypothetical protein